MIHAHTTCRLTRNSELKRVGENDILNFSVATDHGYGEKKTTTYINCSLFGKRANSLVNHLTKGTQIVLHGELFTREYQANDGTTKMTLECRVSEVDLVGGKKEKSDESPSYAHQAPASATDFDDDIGF